MKPRLLIVDDDKHSREGLKKALSNLYAVSIAENGLEALEELQKSRFDMMLTDLRMPKMGGLELIKKAIQLDQKLMIVVFTAYGTIESAVQAMQGGAQDYISKPVNLDELEMVLKRAFKRKELEEENTRLHEQLDKKYGFENIIGNSPAMQEIYETIRQVAPSKATVLIQGESGTGKELIAQAIHQLSPRKNGPFIPVHCAALSESLLEAELFGHEKGAFTGAYERSIGRFERADKGTLFLDEITETSSQLQVKLLRVLQELKFERVGGQEIIESDVRLITASNRNLEELIKKGVFREDLYYRLNVVRLSLPALRERKEDIPILVEHFLGISAKENQKKMQAISPEAMDLLMVHDWPGNVRELRNCIESMVVLSRKDELSSGDIPSHLGITKGANMKSSSVQIGLPIKELEKASIVKTLAATKNNKTKAAKMLGISRRTLHRKIHDYHLGDACEE